MQHWVFYAPWPDSCSLPAAGSGSASIILCGMLLRVQSSTRLVCGNCTHLALHQHQQARCVHMAPMFGGLPLRVVTHGDVGSMSCTLQHNWHCLQVWVSLWLSQAVRPVDGWTHQPAIAPCGVHVDAFGINECNSRAYTFPQSSAIKVMHARGRTGAISCTMYPAVCQATVVCRCLRPTPSCINAGCEPRPDSEGQALCTGQALSQVSGCCR